MRRLGIILPAAVLGLLLTAGPTLACGGLIGPNGAVNLLRTTTFAGYHDGEEHYVTAFEFAGGGGAFGSITPLPGVPSSVEKGGDWTLQRLVRETEPGRPRGRARGSRAAAAAGAEELMKVRIDALDVTVLRGGAADVGAWAKEHGFRLPPDAPEVLDFYAAAQPDLPGRRVRRRRGRGSAASRSATGRRSTSRSRPTTRGSRSGSSPSARPASERVEADVYLLTDRAPGAPAGADRRQRHPPRPQRRRRPTSLLDDLRSDRGMEWVPASAWLTKVAVDASAAAARPTTSRSTRPAPDAPSRVDAGLDAAGRGAVARTVGDRRPQRDRSWPARCSAVVLLARRASPGSA